MGRSRWTTSFGSSATAGARSSSTQGFRRRAAGLGQRTLLADVPVLFRHFGVDPSPRPPSSSPMLITTMPATSDLFATSEVVMSERELAFWAGRHARRAMFPMPSTTGTWPGLAHSARKGASSFRRHLGHRSWHRGRRSGGAHPRAVHREGAGPQRGPCSWPATPCTSTKSTSATCCSVGGRPRPDVRGLRHIGGMVSAGEVTHLVAGHDPSTLSRFNTVSGEYGHLAATIGQLDG